MTVLDFDGNAKFIVRVIKSHANNPSDQWVNSYELHALDPGGGAELLAAANIIVAFEKLMHINVVNFIRMTVSTWGADSVPYDPTAFMSISISGMGNVGVTTGVRPLNECLSLSRVVTSGRFGHVFYRGALDDAECFSPAGKLVFLDGDEMQTRVDTAVTASSIDELFITGSSSLQMTLIDRAGTGLRPVVGLYATGISALSLDHAWFNRTPPAPPGP